MKILILASGAGSTFKNTLEYQLQNSPPWSIVGLISDNPKAGALSVAHARGIPTAIVRQKDFFERDQWAAALQNAISDFSPDLIFLMGFLKKIDSKLIEKFGSRMVNTHPSLLPKFGGEGMYGRAIHEAVVAAGEKRTGVTLHLVSEEYDSGPILMQKQIEVGSKNSVVEVEDRVKDLEKATIIEFLNHWAKGSKGRQNS